MNYLGIGMVFDHVVWVLMSVKDNEDYKFTLKFGVEKVLGQTSTQQSHSYLKTVLDKINDNDVHFLINKWVDITHAKKGNAIDIARLKERLLIACGMTNTLFVDPDSYGWEVYRLEKANTIKSVKLIREVYGLDIKTELGLEYDNKIYKSVADTIIMVEGVAFGRLNGRKRQITDYDFKLIKGVNVNGNGKNRQKK